MDGFAAGPHLAYTGVKSAPAAERQRPVRGRPTRGAAGRAFGKGVDHGHMLVLQVGVALCLIALLAVAVAQLTGGPPQVNLREVVGRPGRWRVGHFERDDATWVVVQRVADKSEGVLDEHLVATIDATDLGT